MTSVKPQTSQILMIVLLFARGSEYSHISAVRMHPDVEKNAESIRRHEFFKYFLFCTLEALSAYAWHVFDQLMSLSASVAFCLKVEILDSGECTNNFCSHSGRVKKKR